MPKGKKKTVDDSIHPADALEVEGDLIDAEMDAIKAFKEGGEKKNPTRNFYYFFKKGGKAKANQKKKKKKNENGKGGDGGKQRMKEMAEIRREGLVEFGESLMEGLEDKLIQYFDDEKKEIFMETVKETLDFYEENWSQSYSEDVFEGKKDEIRTAWDEIVKLCRAEWGEENKDALNAQKEEQKTEGENEKYGKSWELKPNRKIPKISKKQLKELQRQLEEGTNKNKNKSDNESENEDGDENENDDEKQNANEKDKDKNKNKNQDQPANTESQTTAPEEEKGTGNETETKPTKPADDEDWSASDSEEEDDEEDTSVKNKKKKPAVSKQFKDDLSDTETKPKQKKRRKHKKPAKPKEKEESATGKPAEKEEAKQGKPEAKKKDKKSKKKDDDKDSQLKSPIVVVMGHVDTGKTKILDRIRHTSVQAREAGGITQQIGATYLTKEYIAKATARMKEQTSKPFETKLPGLLFIDTPGHESFANLRARGSSMCDIAVLVVDLMHGLEKQTLESLKMLTDRSTPFIVALNKVILIDRCLDWVADEGAPFQLTFQRQKQHTKQDFENRLSGIRTEFAEKGWNTELYFRNKNVKTDISMVPTSAITGEGIPDLLDLLIQLNEKYMRRQLRFKEKFVCTVLEVKNTIGHGTTLDVILSNGTLRKDDTIIVCGMPPQGTIITNIRALLLPSEASEMRERAEYKLVEEVHASAGVRISANGLEHAVPGAHMQIVPRNLKNSKDHAKRREEIEKLSDEVQQDYTNVCLFILLLFLMFNLKKNVMIHRCSRIYPVNNVECMSKHQPLGALEALITFLQDLKPSIPICGINIGDVHKQDVIKAGVMLDHQPEFAVILAFNVKVDPEARELARQNGVQIFTAEIIYHLEDAFNKYMKEIYDHRKAGATDLAVFPVELEILPEHIIHNKYPIVIGVKIVRGTLRKHTPICAKKYDSSGVAAPLYLGKVVGIQVEKKDVEIAKAGEKVAVKIEGDETVKNIQFGRQFDQNDRLVSLISRDSLDALKKNFQDDIDSDDVKHLHALKIYFSVI
ncbi:hypothetical protein RFI_22863 [Reticulomyxa filosa]|uniref:Eukaryotic translation initiation factor 5B n=1 Tax=Reticulomyxa filosa TaxID=46433 RepID=X6MKG8_RETFI|nr:hypothetical protein RFI_22863 [Reticulomyxa filosa]|eukprot:ETO14503.1 hypothetical protein RFI_22863 [Reticulomyxa filosa]